MIGLDLLGGGSKYYNMSEVLRAIPQGCAVGMFMDETFGKLAWTNMTKILDTGRVPACRLQLHWSETHKIVPEDKLKKLLPKAEGLAKKYPNIRVYVSHSCEYNKASKVEVQKRIDLVVKMAPSCIPVQCPMTSSDYTVPGYKIERHGDKATVSAGNLVSGDGQSNYNFDAEAWNNRNAGADIRFAWGSRCNLSEAHNTLKPQERTAYPDVKYLRSLLRILDPIGNAPTPTFAGVIKPIKRWNLWKSHAEDVQGNTSKRDNRPLVMLPTKGGEKPVSIVTFTGESLGKMIKGGHFAHDLTRFYSGLGGGINLYGYQIGNLAKEKSGSEFVWFKQGGTFYGPVNPAFRCGYF